MWRNTFEAQPTRPKRPGRGMYFFEPLETCAPDPSAGVQLYCCYIGVIIFYKYPYQLTENGQDYQEWDRVETQWNNLGQRWTDMDWGWQSLAPLVLCGELIYELSTGEVIWRDGHWWMRWNAWRVGPDDRRWKWILEKSLQEYPPIGANVL